jgi:hypothetical protein
MIGRGREEGGCGIGGMWKGYMRTGCMDAPRDPRGEKKERRFDFHEA